MGYMGIFFTIRKAISYLLMDDCNCLRCSCSVGFAERLRKPLQAHHVLLPLFLLLHPTSFYIFRAMAHFRQERIPKEEGHPACRYSLATAQGFAAQLQGYTLGLPKLRHPFPIRLEYDKESGVTGAI